MYTTFACFTEQKWQRHNLNEKVKKKKTDCSITFSFHEVSLIELQYLWMVIAHNKTGKNKKTTMKFLI